MFSIFSISIFFAHQTFKWSNEARGQAAVHVVIIGFASYKQKNNLLFEYDNIFADPHKRVATNINGYLIAGSNIFIQSRGNPLHNQPKMFKGSQPTDGNHLIFTEEEFKEFILKEPKSKFWMREYIGGAELMRGTKRYCLWLKDCPPNQLKDMPHVLEKLKKVSETRLKSATKSVREQSKYPSLFTQDRQPNSDYLALPRVSSGNREYIPIAYLNSNIIAHEKLIIIPKASIFLFVVLMSYMHNLWAKKISGRLKSDISYSPSVYNNFPWPINLTEKQKNRVEEAAKQVLAVRKEFPESSLADLYDPVLMPPKLVKAHQQLDKAVDLCYRPQPYTSDTNRMEYLLELYDKYTNPLIANNERSEKKMKK